MAFNFNIRASMDRDDYVYDCLFPSWFTNLSYNVEENAEYVEPVIRVPPKRLYLLVEICANKLVSDPACLNLLKNVHNVPKRVQCLLIKTAIERYESFSLVHMLNFWKHQTFQLELPHYCRNWQLSALLRKKDFICPFLTQLLCFSLSIVQYALDMLYSNEEVDSSLHCVDLSQLVFETLGVFQLCTLIKNCKSTIRDKKRLNDTKSDQLFNSDSKNKLTIKLNCILSDDGSVEELFEVMKAEKAGQSPVKILISGLHMHGECPESFLELLKLISVDDLESFTCSGSFWKDSPFIKIYEVLKKFPDLKVLDLSFGYCPFGYISLVADVLTELHQLKQLDLMYSDISGCLDLLLSKMQPGHLEHLNVSYCFLDASDFMFLTSSHFAVSLKNLDISYNEVELDCLNALATSCTSLQVLEMYDCKFYEDDANAATILDILSVMKTLRYLNIGRIKNIDSQALLHNVKYVIHMTDLSCLRISYSHNEDITVESRHRNRITAEFENELQLAFKKIQHNHSKKMKISFCY